MLPFSEACERNKDPILNVLRAVFATQRTVLKIGSGSGQHAVYFAESLPHLRWQPTERAAALPALSSRIALAPRANLSAPLELDVTVEPWPVAEVDAVFSANTLHIMAWQGVEALFEGVGRILAPGGVLAIYGPFNLDGRYSAPSNERFDAQLRRRDPASGIRDLGAVSLLAPRARLCLRANHELPANNRLVVFARAG